MLEPAGQRVVISDTTPLYYLHAVGQLDLLPMLYETVVVPEQVCAELHEGSGAVPDLGALSWVKVRESSVSEALRMVPDLGPGESAVLSLGLECPTVATLLLDDRLARRIAALVRLRFTGTAGVLLKAKQAGLLRTVRPVLAELVAAGFYLRPDHLDVICRMAGE
jgi:predicted nucleic acid-binding protein